MDGPASSQPASGCFRDPSGTLADLGTPSTKKIEIVLSIFFLDQWYEIRSQLQEANWIIQKYLEIKQYATKQGKSKKEISRC